MPILNISILLFSVIVHLVCEGQADIVFVVDSSGSIRESRFQLVKDYMKSVVSEMEIAPDKVCLFGLKLLHYVLKKYF